MKFVWSILIFTKFKLAAIAGRAGRPYCRAPAGLRRADVTEYDDITLEKMADFLLQLMAQLIFDGHSSDGAKGERQSAYSGFLVLVVRIYALERLLGDLEGSLVTCFGLQ